MKGQLSRPWIVGATVAVLLAGASTARAQFGLEARAGAARQVIVLGVSQGIQSLPPTSAQSFTYEYDAKLDTYVASGQLGPAMSRSPRTIAKNAISVRLAASYFSLSENFGTIPYLVRPLGPGSGIPEDGVYTRLGLDVDAKVGVLGFAASYGVLDRLEIGLSVPVTIVNAEANNIATFRTDNPNAFGAARSIEELDRLIANGDLFLLSEPVNDLSTEAGLGSIFNDSTSLGLGQIGINSKYALYEDSGFAVAAAFDLLFPSPSEDDYAGPDSFSLIPRAIFSAQLFDQVSGHADVGYNYTVDFQELQALVWHGSISWATDWTTLDAGAGGHYYSEGLRWTPETFRQQTQALPVDLQLDAAGDNQLGVNYVDFLFGAKVKLTDQSVLSGTLSVPVNDEGFRPDVVGTLAVEMYF